MGESVIERVEFRLLNMECCGHLLCWVNPRLPTFCPTCGKSCYPAVRSWVTMLDTEATLKLKEKAS